MPGCARVARGTVNIGFDKATASHGIFAELGTSHSPAKPILRPALDSEEKNGKIQNAFILALNKTIQKRLKKNRG